MNSFEPTAPMAVAALTFLLLIFCLVVWWILGSSTHPILYYDDCNWVNFRSQYVVRLLYDGKSTSFQNLTTTVFVQIAHSINRVVKIPLTPEALSRVLLYKGHPCAKVFVRSTDRYRDVRGVSLFHDGLGSLLAHSVELQDIDVSNAVIATVQHPVFGQGYQLKTFPFGTETPTLIEDDVRPTRNVTIYESVFFFFIAFNIAFLVDLYVLTDNCISEDCFLHDMLLFGFCGGLAGFGTLVLLIIPFRYYIKEYYYLSIGRGCAALLRIVYLFFLFFVGIVLDVLVGYFPHPWAYKDINSHIKTFSAPITWTIVILVSLFVEFCLSSVMLTCAVYFRFITTPPVSDWSLLKSRNKARGHKSIGNYKSDEAIEYSRMSSMLDNNSKPEAALSGFYRTLANQKYKVKSISTFMLPIKQKPHHNHHQHNRSLSPRHKEMNSTSSSRTSPDTGHSNTKRGKVYNKPPGGSHPTRRPPITRTPSSEASQVSSVGDNYYETILKMAKIRSVSEYHYNPNK